MGSGPAAGRARGLAALIMGGCIIGTAPILVRLAMDAGCGATAVGFWRLLLATPLLLLIAGPDGIAQGLRAWPMAALAGMAFAGDLAAWHASIRLTTVFNATLLSNLAPVFVIAGAALLLGERTSLRLVVGGVVALGGAALLVVGREGGARSLAGDLLGALSALFYGIYQLAMARLRRHIGAGAGMAIAAVTGALPLLALALLLGEHVLPRDAQAWAAVLALALLTHSAGQGLIVYALAHVPAGMSSVVLLVQPVVAAGLAWALFREAPGTWQFLGALLIVAGIVVARRAAGPQPVTPIPSSGGG